MRDIRADLRERLAAAEAKRAQLNAGISVTTAEIQAVMSLMEIEDKRLAVNGASAEKKVTMPLEDFILAQINARPMDKNEITRAAQAEGYEITGRNVHGHMMKFVRSGAVSRRDDEKYVSQRGAE